MTTRGHAWQVAVTQDCSSDDGKISDTRINDKMSGEEKRKNKKRW